MRYDRDELLARTDLAVLADELLGDHAGHGRNARWPSPVPDHPQTGRTPPMSIFTDRRGIQRWTCFATGTSGTAIDLVTTATGRSVGDAIAWLAGRSQLPPGVMTREPPRRAAPPRPQPPREPSAALRAYVESCEQILWKPAGAAIRSWLIRERRLDPDVLRRNRIGADPGPRILPRAPGLPRRGPAAVFPALDGQSRATYLQARYLHPPPGRGKYDNPTAAHGANARIAPIEPSASGASGPTIITEGIPDALAAAGAGYRAIAILGAAIPNRHVAERLASRDGLLVVAFDTDVAGRNGSARLHELLTAAGRTDVIDVAPPAADLNTWLIARGPGQFTRQMRMSVSLAATAVRRPGLGRSIA